MKKIILFLILINFIFSKDIQVALGDSLAPYIIKPNLGMEYEIIKRALEIKGHKMKPIFVPFARLFKSVQSGTYDAVATVKEDGGIKNVYYSDEYIIYRNIVVSVKKFEIKKLSDLSGKSIIAFQNSKLYLGSEYGEIVGKNKKFSEIANQEAQVASLMNGRTDVIVIDINIFKYYLKNSKLFKTKPYIIYYIFKETPYKIAFKDKKIRDDFNEGLENLKTSGEYEKIIKRYIE